MQRKKDIDKWIGEAKRVSVSNITDNQMTNRVAGQCIGKQNPFLYLIGCTQEWWQSWNVIVWKE